MGRRACIKCGGNYNVCGIKRDDYDMEPQLPKKDAKCEGCRDVGKLVVREDDRREVIEKRMGEYRQKTQPIVEEFRKRGVLMDF